MVLNPSIRKVIPASLPEAAANYDYFDIAEGSGIKDFYGAYVSTSGAVNYFLTGNEATYSGVIAQKIARGTGTCIELSDLDYDILFNKPKLINGKVRVQVTQGTSYNGVGVATVFLIMYLYKVSDGVETEIGATSPPHTTLQTKGSASTADPHSETKLMEWDTGGKIHFRKGDILRLNIRHWGGGQSATAQTGYGCDPKDRNDRAKHPTSTSRKIILDEDTTQLKISVPFIIDI